MSAPSIIALPFTDWAPSWPLLGATLLAAGCYILAASRAGSWPKQRTLAFLCGLLVIQVALSSGVGAYDDRLLSVHMVQHLLLLELAPVLLLCGRPIHLALKLVRGRPRRRLGRGLVTAGKRATPIRCLLFFVVVVLVAHVPPVFNATVHHQLLHEAEHGAFLVAGLMMWWPLHGDPAPRQRLGTIGQLAYITAAMAPMALIGGYLNRDPTLFYSAYAAPARMLHIGAVSDQQQAGAIMWVAGTTLMAWIGLSAVLGSMLAAERRQQARDLNQVLR